jgi:hypothetical protein
MPVLDIGGDVGALVVTTDPAAVGTELYLRSESDPDLHVHTGVWRREATGGFTTTAVFLELLAGAYWVLDDEGADVCPVEINGGELTELDIRS